MAITYINIFQSKALQNYPNWDFWFENKPSGNPGLPRVGVLVKKYCRKNQFVQSAVFASFFVGDLNGSLQIGHLDADQADVEATGAVVDKLLRQEPVVEIS
jgi:hypothetical protein